MKKKIALILSGGAARGAYEAGVIKALLPELEKHGAGISILSGTSVGSINASYLASIMHLPVKEIVENLEHYWLTFKKEHVFKENWSHAGLRSFLGSLKISQPDFQGFLDYGPLRKIIENEIDWAQVKKNIDDGRIYALTTSATSISTGKSVVFYQCHDPNVIKVISRDSHTRFVSAEISPKHIIASSSIPILFKPEYIKFVDHGEDHGDWFFDGGMRQNTPLYPALTLGADALIIIGLHHLETQVTSEDEKPGLIPNVGKLLNALFLESIKNDTKKLDMINDILETIGDEKIIKKINDERIKKGRKPFKRVPDLFVSPSRMISEIAEEIWDGYPETRSSFKTLDWLFKVGNLKGHPRGDVLSYFFFNPYYAKELIELGYKDTINTMNSEVWDPLQKKNVKLIDKILY